MECSDEIGRIIAAVIGAILGGGGVGFAWHVSSSRSKQIQKAGDNANQTQIGRDRNG